MKIQGVRVDGYGILHDLEIGDLPDGLTVFHGANEAGKSTLLDFIRGVLFGFPDRRHRAPFHEPLRGGRHGGALALRDEHGVGYLLERHVEAKAPVLTRDGGALRDPGELASLLGGADDTLFRSVFAFGLGELSSFESLDRDEIRDLVFSAGVIGAGRSATRAAKAIEQRRVALVRQRRGEAVANGLRHELDEVESALRHARRGARDLPIREREHARLAHELAHAKQTAESLHNRRRELDQLIGAWPIARRKDAAERALSELVSGHGDVPAVLAVAETVDRLAADRSGRHERERRRAELAADLDAVLAELALARRALGLPEDAEFLSTTEVEAAEAARLEEFARTTAAERRALADQHAAAARTHATSFARLVRPDGMPPPRPPDELRAAALALGELRSLVRERDRAESRATEDAHAHDETVGGRRARAGIAAAAALALLAVAALALDASGHKLALIPVLIGGVAALVLGVVTVLGRARTRTARPTPPSVTDERRAREIARLAEECGCIGEITEATIDSALARIDDERDARRVWDALRAEEEADRSRLENLGQALDELERRAEVILEQCAALGGRVGFTRSVDPVELGVALSTMNRGAERTAAARRIEQELAALDAEFARDREALVRCADVAHVAVSDDDATLDALIGAVDRARAASIERTQLERTLAEATIDLGDAVGSGAHADRLLAELSGGDLLGWQAELEQIALEAPRVDERHDEALAAVREAERVLDELRRSSEVATLELRHASLEASLQRALGEWALLGVAHALLDDALARYERDRQPAVIALAAGLFAEVTEGRYVALVPREEVDGARRRGIDVITPSGARVSAADLSRGTAEQLYLCLRLAFASTFAERSVTLPIVLDDVLVNFDPMRARAMAGAIARTAESHQVLAFTCHPHVVEHFAATGPMHLVNLTGDGALVGVG